MAIRQEDFKLLQGLYVDMKFYRDGHQSNLAGLQHEMETEMCLNLDVPIEELVVLEKACESVVSGTPRTGKTESESSEELAEKMMLRLGYVALRMSINDELGDRLTRYERYLSQAC